MNDKKLLDQHTVIKTGVTQENLNIISRMGKRSTSKTRKEKSKPSRARPLSYDRKFPTPKPILSNGVIP